MTVTIRVTIEDITTQMLTYDVIRVYMATSLEGEYSLQDTITLVAGTYHYSWDDTDGTLNNWYKYSLYNATGPVESAKSDPFRVAGTTRLRIRQEALSRYGCGLILVNTGTDENKITTVDHRFATSFYPANRGLGQWLRVSASNNNVGKTRIISESSPTAGTMTVLPSFGADFISGDEVEWHTLIEPTEFDSCINRGLARYWYVEIVPIVPGPDNEYSLAGLPWLASKDHVHDVRWFPVSTLEVDESYVGNGRWWDVKDDKGELTLVLYPAVSATQVLYLECTRPMPALYTDDAALPNVANEQLAAALAYDEVLKHLGSYGVGTIEQRASYRAARVLHRPELRRLLREHRPKPRFSPPRGAYPPVAPQPFKARG